MFAVEVFSSQDYEERAAAEAARRLASQNRGAAQEASARAPVATTHSAPSHLQQTLYRPATPASAAGSATVLGSIFQNFMRKAPSTPGVSPAATPNALRDGERISAEELQRRTAERLLAEVKRDADIVCSRFSNL